jgi:hypothetical protein
MSEQSTKMEEPMLKKEIVYVNDQQQGSYVSQCQIDLSSLANSTRWQSWKEAVVEVPFTVLVENLTPDVVGIDDVINSSFLSLKNGGMLVDYLTVTFNNVNVVQLTNYMAHIMTFKMLAGMSSNAEATLGPSVFFAKDNSTSFQFGGTGPSGVGFTNNRPTFGPTGPTMSTTGYHGSTYNAGFKSRLMNTLDTKSTTNFYSDIVDPANLKLNGTSYFSRVSATLYKYNILCTIRLGDIDFFQKLPLIRGGFCQITLGYNSSVQTLSFNATTKALSSSAPVITGHTNPLLVSSADVYQPNEWMAGATGNQTYRISSNLVNTTDSNGNKQSNDILSSVRTVMPLLTMNPEWEKNYISTDPIREIFYEDFYQYSINNISAGGQINQIITNGVSRPKYLIIGCYANKSSNLGFTSTEPYNSPFDTAPATTTPCALVTSFNILVSGTPIYAQNFDWDYEQFQYELQSILSLNGAKSDRLMSGLISQQDFQFGYRFLAVDLSRRIPADDISRSIQVIGKNNTKLAMDYICFLAFEKKIKCDIRNSQIIA